MPRTAHILRRAALAALTAAALAPATALAAFPDDPSEPPGDPGAYVAKPDLRVTDVETHVVDAGWQINYTVRNSGDLASGPSQVATIRDGTSNAVTRSVPGLEPGATATHGVVLPRSTCYAAFRVTADLQKAVVEHSEINNETWTVGQAATTCADAPKYQVTAVELHSLRTQEAVDETYFTFSSVSESAATTKRSPIYPDMNDGERRSTSVCMWSTSTCAGRAAPHGIGLSVQLFDHDSGDLDAVRAKVDDAFKKAGPISVLLGQPLWVTAATALIDDVVDQVLALFDDDTIGGATWAYSPVDLARRLREPGDTILESRAFHDGENAGDAYYYLKLRIARTA